MVKGKCIEMGNQYKEWTKEEIINRFKEFYDEHGRTPKMEDLKSINNLPCYKRLTKTLECKTLNEAILQCGLQPNKYEPSNKITLEQGLNKLKEYCYRLGHTPTYDEYKSSKSKPEISWFYERCGGFQQALLRIGVINEIITEEIKLKNSVSHFTSLSERLNKCPTAKEYFDVLNGKDNCLCFKKVIEKSNMKYNEFCSKYLPQFELNNEWNITYDQIVGNIHNCVKALGKVPTYKEYKKYCDGKYSSLGVFKRACGKTFLEMLNELGYISENTTTSIMDKETALQHFKDLCLELERTPTSDEIDERKYMPSYSSYLKYFSSIDNIMKLLNMEDFKIHRTGLGRTVKDKNGHTCRSITECNITNYFINNNIQYTKENSYNELIDGDNHRFDWRIKINGNYFYIEYFGLFSDKPHNKLSQRYYDKTKLKTSLLKKYNVADKCIFIFPNDLKTKTLDEIFKPYLNNCNYKNVSNL